jgi:hypothetical protein
MKKIFLSVLLIAITSTIQAQDDTINERAGFQAGVKVGANYSNIYDAKGEEFTADPKLGLAFGAYLGIPLGKYLGFHPEVLFSQKGFKGTGNLLGSSYELTRTSNFLDVPLFLALKPIGMVTIVAGPQFSFLMSQKDTFSNSTITIDQEKEFDNENVRKNIMCFVGGVDINLKNIVLAARAGWDFQTNHGDGTSSTPRYKNSWLQATIGYRFY